MPTIKECLSEQLKAAMKAREKNLVTFARNLHAAIRKREIDSRVDLDDTGIQKLIASLMKQRQESIEQFQKGGREDLVAKEQAEFRFLQSFMPVPLEESELRKLIDWAIQEVHAVSPKDLGHVMKLLIPKVEGRADGKLINQLVRERIGQTGH